MVGAGHTRTGACRALLLLLAVGCGGPIGERYEGVDALAMSPTWADWVVVGRFGPDGPFELVEVRRCDIDQPCTFSHRGQGHVYDGFDGYALTVLELRNQDGLASHVVMRSRSPRD